MPEAGAALPTRFRRALGVLADRLAGLDEPWALTGSTSFALQGVALEPNDVDVQTSERGAYLIGDRLEPHTTEAVRLRTADRIRSHYGRFEVADIPVEVMGAVRTRPGDGPWGPPVDVAANRRTVAYDGLELPVLALRHEVDAYERLGRSDRADLIRRYLDEPG